MDKLIFLDTETTGNDFFKDRLFQVCYSYRGRVVSQFFKPLLPISIKAQSITNITNKMLEGKAGFENSKMKKDLQKILTDNILVAHNAQFDIAMIVKEGIEVPKFICTLKLARFLDEESIIPEYNLQYLRYYHELDINVFAHDAKSDVLVLEGLFKKLYEIMIKTYKSEDAVIAKMLEVSSKPFLIKLFNFGKYKGRRVEEILILDKGYLQWLLLQKQQNGGGDEDWMFTLKYHLKIEDKKTGK